MTSTPLPEQGGFNERLDEILTKLLWGISDIEYEYNETNIDSNDRNIASEAAMEKAGAAIRTLVLEELESKSERLFEWDGGQYEPVEAVPLSVIKKLGGTNGTK